MDWKTQKSLFRHHFPARNPKESPYVRISVISLNFLLMQCLTAARLNFTNLFTVHELKK